MRELEATKMQHETARLLYVATTRAKRQLHLMVNLSLDAEASTLRRAKQGSFLDLLWPQQQQQWQQQINTFISTQSQENHETG